MHYREMVLLQQSAATKDGKAQDDKAAKELEREIIHLPILTSTLHGYVNNVLFFWRWVHNEMNVEFSCCSPFLKTIWKPVLMLINHYVFPVLLLVQSGKWKSSIFLWLYPFFALDTCYMFSRALLTYIYIQRFLYAMKVKAYSLCGLTSYFPAFFSGRFLRVASVEVDLVGFIFPSQTRWSSQGTLPSVFSYARICTWIARLL